MVLSTVPVDVRPGALCVDGPALAEALKDAPNPRDGRVLVVAAPPGDLVVRASWPDGQGIERRVPAPPSECAAVRRVLLALVRSWLAAPPPAAAPVPMPTPRPLAAIPHGAPAVAAPAPAAAAPPPTPPPLTAAPGPELPPDPLHEQAAAAHAAAAAPPPEPPAGSQWHFGAGAVGGFSAGTTPAAAAVGGLFLELVRRQTLGVGLDGGLASSRVSVTPNAWASERWLTLYAKGALPLTERIALVATLGVRGWWIEAGTPGRPGRSLFGGGGVLTVGPEAAVGPLTLLVRAVFAARYPEERLLVGGTSALLLKGWQVGLVAGLGWHFP